MSSSGGGGGKSLELMQQRLKQQQQAQPQVPPPQVDSTKQESTAGNANSQQSQPIAPVKRPGKDIAAMSMSVKNTATVAPPSTSQPQKVTAPPSASSVPTVVSSKPKGKDFSAMAARMAPVPAQQPIAQPSTTVSAASNAQLPQTNQPQTISREQTTTSEAEAARQRQIDAARRAAGYNPISAQAANLQKLKQQQLAQAQSQQSKKPQQQIQAMPPTSQVIRNQTQLQGQPQPQPTHEYQIPISSQVQYQQSTHQAQQHQIHQQQQQFLPQPTHVSSITAQQAAFVPTSNRPVPSKATPEPKSSEARLSSVHGTSQTAPLIGERLRDLLHSLDPNYNMDSQAEEETLRLAQEFLDQVVSKSIRMSQHRGSKTLDVQDVQFVLAKQWGIVIPGLGPPSRPAQRAPAALKRKPESIPPGSSPPVKRSNTGI
jgi:histone H3/H4